nr:hypothetical protein [Chryseobacterium oranimense]
MVERSTAWIQKSDLICLSKAKVSVIHQFSMANSVVCSAPFSLIKNFLRQPQKQNTSIYRFLHEASDSAFFSLPLP